MKRLIVLVCCVALFLSTTPAQKRPFISKPHSISASIPNGWDQIQGVRDNTVLKLARSGRVGQTARIAVVLDDIPKGRLAPDFDIWDMSNDDIRKATEGSSLRGETILVVDTGRAAIDGIHVVWNKNRRKIPNGSGAEMWEFAYEGIRDSKYLTIRLTSVGNQNWFASNQAIFSDFIRTLRLKTN
jgi:hypothetical protein